MGFKKRNRGKIEDSLTVEAANAEGCGQGSEVPSESEGRGTEYPVEGGDGAGEPAAAVEGGGPDVVTFSETVPGASPEATAASLERVKAKVKEAKRLEMEAKYAHLLPGSMRDVPNGEIVDDVRSKGRVCTIVCVDCGAHRTVNVQDVHQTTRCRPCRLTQAAKRSRDRDAGGGAAGEGGEVPSMA